MSVIWQYLDKRAATIKALKDYSSMEYILQNTDAEISHVHDKMSAIRSPSFDGAPHTHDPKAGEYRMVQGIAEIDVLKERYRQAVEYMDWLKPAWNELSEDEQYVLETFYRGDESQSGAVYAIPY